ncbi:hypothetical protein Tco_1248731 [Tanacetum coccineum]
MRRLRSGMPKINKTEKKARSYADKDLGLLSPFEICIWRAQLLESTRQVNMFMKLFRSDDKFSQMLTQLESQPEIGGGGRSDGRGDDE